MDSCNNIEQVREMSDAPTLILMGILIFSFACFMSFFEDD